MKHWTVCLLLAAMLLPLFGCAAENAPVDETKDVVCSGNIVLSEEELSVAATDFAIALLQSVHTEGATTVVSPLSVMTAIAMTANGAAGQTRAQIEQMLGASIEQWNDRFAAAGESDSLISANSIWIRNTPNLTVKEDFLNIAEMRYGAEVCRAAFDETTCSEINEWVSENTDGRIEKIVETISADTAMYLINALCFEADWANPFYENEVMSGEFHAADGTNETVELMRGDVTRYLEGENVVGFCKDYVDDRFTFLALLPDETITAEDYLDTLSAETLSAILSGETKKGLYVSLPKLTLQTELTLNDALCNMGMTDAFDAGKADFSALADVADGELYIGRVAHQTQLTIDTQGTKAAAATSVEMMFRMSIKQEKIELTRPFLLAIWDNEFDLPVFLGIVNSTES